MLGKRSERLMAPGWAHTTAPLGKLVVRGHYAAWIIPPTGPLCQWGRAVDGRDSGYARRVT